MPPRVEDLATACAITTIAHLVREHLANVANQTATLDQKVRAPETTTLVRSARAPETTTPTRTANRGRRAPANALVPLVRTPLAPPVALAQLRIAAALAVGPVLVQRVPPFRQWRPFTEMRF